MKIKLAAEKYLNALGQNVKRIPMRIQIIDSKEINAWCMPGG
jgi:Zn-dependent protease with chaperone function